MVFPNTTAVSRAFAATTPLIALPLVAAGLVGLGHGHAWAVPLLLSPVLEEVIFRLGVHRALLDRSRSPGALQPLRRALATAAAFAATHVLLRPSWSSALTLVPALAIGAVYECRRELLPCIALHALFNTAWWFGSTHLA